MQAQNICILKVGVLPSSRYYYQVQENYYMKNKEKPNELKSSRQDPSLLMNTFILLRKQFSKTIFVLIVVVGLFGVVIRPPMTAHQAQVRIPFLTKTLTLTNSSIVHTVVYSRLKTYPPLLCRYYTALLSKMVEWNFQ